MKKQPSLGFILETGPTAPNGSDARLAIAVTVKKTTESGKPANNLTNRGQLVG
jgi:hypothetical protein